MQSCRQTVGRDVEMGTVEVEQPVPEEALDGADAFDRV